MELSPSCSWNAARQSRSKELIHLRVSAFARKRPAARIAKFSHGDAMALPFPADAFDAATMALVISFVPEPIKGVAEMTRVVRPGGVVATYIWDMLGGGYPWEPIRIEMSAMAYGSKPAEPRSIADRGAARLVGPRRPRCSR